MDTRINRSTHLVKPTVFFITVFCLLMLGIPFQAAARNAAISNFTKNISGFEPEGETWVDYNSEVQVSGKFVHILWVSRKGDWTEIRICYSRSTDGGVTFELPRVLYSVTTSTNDLICGPTLRMMAVEGKNVHIAFSRSYPSSAERNWYYNLYYLRSTNNGATFKPPRKLFGGTDVWRIENVRIAADSGGKVTIGYNYYANWYNNYSFRTFNSADGGATFKKKVVGSSADYSGTLYDLKRVGDDVYLLYSWTLEPVYYGNFQALINVAASNDGGATFKRKQLSTKATDGRYYAYGLHDNHYSPNLAVAGNNVYAVWTQNGTAYNSNNISLCFRRSTDKGATFGPVKKLATNGVGMGDMSLGGETVAAQGNYVYVVFFTTGSRVYLRRSRDAGAGFLARQELTVPGVRFLEGGWWPLVQTDPAVSTGEKVHVVWNPATYLFSSNGGAKFTRQGMLRTKFLEVGPQSPNWALGADGKVHVSLEGAWATASSGGYGDSDIFYRRWPTAPELNAPSGTPKALKLVGIYNEIYDNMQVAASPSINFKTAMTAEAWIKPSRNDNAEGYFLYKCDPGKGGAWGSYMLGQWRNGQLDARIATADNGFVLGGGPAIPNDQWTHVAMTYNSAATGNNFKIYVNGELAGETAATGKLDTKDGLLFVGADNSYNYRDGIQIRELRLWKGARSASAIKNNMNKTLTGNESGLAALYNFEDTTRDSTPNANHGMLMYQETFVEQ
ncbi:MAG: hypothetical protein C4567_11550 [Deltaproteobacteria bacterium]|nr:MAG: hypothetical protein C4567_11550 [Deltaproteobacteria bacterium]